MHDPGKENRSFIPRALINFLNPDEEKRTKDSMKLCRFQLKEKASNTTHPEIFQGVISGETVRQVSGDIIGKWEETSKSFPLADVKLVPPVMPSKNVCMGRNYLDH